LSAKERDVPDWTAIELSSAEDAGLLRSAF